MPNGTPGKSSASTDAAFNRMTWMALALATLLTALWLWSCWCSFPGNPWNDIRLSPAVALHLGISVFQPPGTGPASTWAYGPLPPLVMWPAGLASTARGALEAGGALHIGLWLLAFALIGRFWPATNPPDSPVRDWQRRLAAVLLCVLLLRNEVAGYTVYTADATGMIFALLGSLALVRDRYWLAAFCASAAVACKQIMVGVGAAQVLWLFLAVSPREALRHIGRGAVTAIALALLMVLLFDGRGLWQILFEMPAKYRWAPSIQARIAERIPYLLVHVAAPVVLMIAARRFFLARQSPGLLPSLSFLCTLPLCFAGFLKNGGNINSLHSFWLWFPPALIAVVTARPFARFGAAGCLALAILPVAVASLWLQTTRLRLRPNVQAYVEAAELTQQLPHQVWFPMNPIVTLYSDRRLYHDYDGLLVYAHCGYRPDDTQYAAWMPRHRKVVATLLPVGWGPANTAEARLPADAVVRTFGTWQLQITPQ